MQKFVFITTVMVTGSAFANPNILHTHIHTPTKLESVSPLLPTGSYKIASICFLGNNCENDASFGKGDDYNLDSAKQCHNDGFQTTSCPNGYAPYGECPFDNRYFQKCVTIDQICTLNDYATTCDKGQILDPFQACEYDKSYQKCKCNPCTGYNYTYEEAIEQGYMVDEVCESCSETKYKRKANDCVGFIECDCGGEVGAKVCWSSSIRKFSSCKKCYVKSDAKVGDILYSDMSTLPINEELPPSDVAAGIVPIGVVFDARNRYAVSIMEFNEYAGTWQEYRAAEDLPDWKCTHSWGNSCGVDIPDLPNLSVCDADGYNCKTVLEKDMSGRANTQAIIAFGKKKNISYPVAEYCNNYTTKGTTAGQWFLPSITELITLRQNEKAIRATFSKYYRYNCSLSDCYNIFGTYGLWSSSELTNSNAFIMNSRWTTFWKTETSAAPSVRPVIQF